MAPVGSAEQRAAERRAIVRRLSSLRWPMTALAMAVAFALGWTGFEASARASGVETSATTTLYHVIHLFEFSMPTLPEPLPWQLEIARYLAPAVTLYAAASAILALLGGRIDELRARWSSGHVIVVGLGPLGARAARSLRAAGHRVVAVDVRPGGAAVAACRDAGVIVLAGEPADPDALRRAGVARAAYLLVLTDDDDSNARIAIDARRLVAGRGGPPLSCFVQLGGRSLVELLARLGISGSPDPRVRVEPLDVFDLAARTILDRYPPFDPSDVAAASPRGIAIVGLAGSGSALLGEVARRWHQRAGDYPGSTRPLPILLVDRDAHGAATSFAERSPGLASRCRIRSVDVEGSAAGPAAAAAMSGADGSGAPTCVYVCLGDDAASLNAGLTIRHDLGSTTVPIVVETLGDGGASAILADDPGHPIHRELGVVALLDLVTEPEALLSGRTETIARALHAQYLETQRLAGTQTATAVPWEQLPAAMRESNRRQASDIGRKLQAVGCAIDALGGSTTAPVELTAAEIETMARLEHDRWMADRRSDGWRFGVDRDDERKLTPYLVPYDDLPEAIKDIDRVFVRDIPARLAAFGFEVRRVRDQAGASDSDRATSSFAHA